MEHEEGREESEAAPSQITSSLLSTVFEQSSEGIIFVDRRGRVRLFNSEAERLHGIDREVAMRPGWATSLPLYSVRTGLPLGQEEMPVFRALRGERLERESWRIRLPDGRERTLSGSATPLISPDGELLGAVLLTRDDTEHEALEAAQRQALEEARRSAWWSGFLSDASRLFNASLEVQTTLTHLARLVVPVLAEFCMIDLLRDQQLERVAISHPDPRRVAAGWEFLRRHPTELTGDTTTMRALRTRQSQLVTELSPEVFAREAHGRPDYAEELQRRDLGSYLVVPLLARDRVLGLMILVHSKSRGRKFSTEDVRRGEDLAQRAASAVDNAMLYDEAQQAIRLRDDFLSVASHELKTPLTPLKLRIDALLRQDQQEGGEGSFVPSGTLVSLSRQIGKLSALIDGLLDVSRLRAGRLALRSEAVDLTQVVRDVVRRFEAQSEQAGCEVRVVSEGPLMGRWDRLRIEQVLTNLFTNAVKYGAGRPVTLRVFRRGRNAVVQVEDQGIGIEREHLERIFGQFERAVSGRHYGGLGLGLYISRQIVRELGGELRVESELGRGALFEVSLPLK